MSMSWLRMCQPSAIPNTRDNWHASFQTDMMGTYHIVDAALPFLAGNKGNIITISCVVDFVDVASRRHPSYGTMKAAVIHCACAAFARLRRWAYATPRHRLATVHLVHRRWCLGQHRAE